MNGQTRCGGRIGGLGPTKRRLLEPSGGILFGNRNAGQRMKVFCENHRGNPEPVACSLAGVRRALGIAGWKLEILRRRN